MTKLYFTLTIIVALFSQSLFANCDLSAHLNFKTKGLVVNFTNRSVGNYEQLNWNFGDGTVSNESAPTHTYQSAGTYQFSLTVTTAQGCQSMVSSKVYVFNSRQVSKAISVENINAYPNPFTETSQVSLVSQANTTATITLNDMNGKVAATVASNTLLNIGNNTITLYRNNLPAGMYVLNIVTPTQLFTHKVQII